MIRKNALRAFLVTLVVVMVPWQPLAGAARTTEASQVLETDSQVVQFTSSDAEVARAVAALAQVNEARAEETTTPIKHFITIMQENHSFDNYFGTYPGANGFSDDTCVFTEGTTGECVAPFHLGNQAIIDLGHSEQVFEDQFADGAMTGFISAFTEGNRPGGTQAMGYYDDEDLPYYWNVADNYVLFDNFFTSSKGGSVRNHFYWVAGAPGNTEEDKLRPEGFDDVPTIFDSLQEADISWKFYVQNYDPEITYRNPVEGAKGSQLIWAPLLNYARFLDEPELNARIVPLDEFFDDLANDELAAVSYIVPSGSSEHPPGSIQAGERFMRSLITALMRSDSWESSALTWTYDDWGGWFDHVPPPQVDEYGYGFRAPSLLVSPYAREGYIDSTQLDFTSILKFIQLNWGLEPLAERDAAAETFMGAFDFEAGPRTAILLDRERDVPEINVPRTDVVYIFYGAAVLLAIFLLSMTTLRPLLARRGAGSVVGKAEESQS